MDAKEVLDQLFEGVEFDKAFIDKLIRINISFTTTNTDIRDMLGDKLLGCYHLSYTQYHKNIFYEDLFDYLSYDEVMKAINKITSIRRDFKIARDDINLVCFYMVHRFVKNKKLSKEDQKTGCIEAFNYFGYRTLILMNNKYWIYPITQDQARTVYESLSGNYLITQRKNWNDYVHYRSEQYYNSKLMEIVKNFTDKKRLPNAINDLYGRYNDMVKNIYREFMYLEDNDYIKSNKTVVKDLEGHDVLLDRLSDPIKYIDKILDALVSRTTFIKESLIEITSSIVTSVSQDQMEQCLQVVSDYYHSSPKNTKAVAEFVEDFMTDSLAYLQANKLFINNKSNIIEIINVVVSNLLYSRGAGISITAVKLRGEKLMEQIYRKERVNISKRNLTNVRNGFCVYILLLGLL